MQTEEHIEAERIEYLFSECLKMLLFLVHVADHDYTQKDLDKADRLISELAWRKLERKRKRSQGVE